MIATVALNASGLEPLTSSVTGEALTLKVMPLATVLMLTDALPAVFARAFTRFVHQASGG